MLTDLTPDLTAQFAQNLPHGTLSEPEARYLEEPRGRWAGQAGCLARPRSTQDVAALVTLCAQAGVAVVPYSGGTGLVGGQIAPDGPIPLLLSLERMTAIRDIRAEENVLVAEAGAVLTDVQDAAQNAGRLFPLSLASEGSARIGGLLSTNAGGTGVLRYGNARDLCLGVEAVQPDGTILHGLKRLRKDNTGYDLRHLLIGAEGTLGVITAASLKLSPRPSATGTALLVTASPAAALDLLAVAREVAGEGVSAFELIHRQGLDFLAETVPDLRLPWPDPPEWCVLIELGCFGDTEPAAALEEIFAKGAQAGLISDGIIAQSAQQSADLWAVREHLPEGNRRIGSISSHDIALPLSEIDGFITQAGTEIAKLGAFRINCFGHLGDGNLHYNVFPMPGRSRADHLKERDQIKGLVHDMVHARGGSVSAEHGIGRLKVDDLERYGDPAKLATMRAIKSALDPAGIMNPGAVLRP